MIDIESQLMESESTSFYPEMMDSLKIQAAVRMILEAVGEDPDREGLAETPQRVARMYKEIFAGLHEDPRKVLSARFQVGESEMVVVKDIPFYSMCEHHLLPFYGKASIAYIPRDGVVTGLSKLARLIDMTAKRPQVQERLTNQAADALFEELEAQGVLVLIEAEHMCMSMRGIQKPGSVTTTIATRGILANKDEKEYVLQVMRNHN